MKRFPICLFFKLLFWFVYFFKLFDLIYWIFKCKLEELLIESLSANLKRFLICLFLSCLFWWNESLSASANKCKLKQLPIESLSANLKRFLICLFFDVVLIYWIFKCKLKELFIESLSANLKRFPICLFFKLNCWLNL